MVGIMTDRAQRPYDERSCIAATRFGRVGAKISPPLTFFEYCGIIYYILNEPTVKVGSNLRYHTYFIIIISFYKMCNRSALKSSQQIFLKNLKKTLAFLKKVW